MAYVELHACSAFSFLRGASFPEQLAEVAAELEMPALAVLDRNGVYGAQRFSVAAREQKIRPITGCELTMEDGTLLPVLVANRIGYKNLCELLTQAHLRSSVKAECSPRHPRRLPWPGWCGNRTTFNRRLWPRKRLRRNSAAFFARRRSHQ